MGKIIESGPMEDVGDFGDYEEPVKTNLDPMRDAKEKMAGQKQASNEGQTPNDTGADDAEDSAGTSNDHGEEFSPAEETAGNTIEGPPAENTDTTRSTERTRSVGAFWVYPGGVSQDHAEEEGNDSEGNDSEGNDSEEGNDNDNDAVADSAAIVEAALVEEGVYDAYPIHLTHVPISSEQHDNGEGGEGQGKRNFFKKKKCLSWGLISAGLVVIAAGMGAYFGTKDKTKTQDSPG
eukprot:13128773-Ditylum_brightwellii.AAC.1